MLQGTLEGLRLVIFHLLRSILSEPMACIVAAFTTLMVAPRWPVPRTLREDLSAFQLAEEISKALLCDCAELESRSRSASKAVGMFNNIAAHDKARMPRRLLKITSLFLTIFSSSG
jgi:hypothetical protein